LVELVELVEFVNWFVGDEMSEEAVRNIGEYKRHYSGLLTVISDNIPGLLHGMRSNKLI